MIIATIGIMLSGPDKDYQSIITNLENEKHTLVGTSMNKSGDARSQGSAHHRISGVIRQFKHEGRLCIYVPKRFQELRGSSTTMVYINVNATKAYIIRAGSLGINRTKDLLVQSGIRSISQLDQGIKHVHPYRYGKFERISMWFHHKHLLLKTYNKDFFCQSNY